MQAMYSLSAFLFHTGLSQLEQEAQKLKTLSLAGLLFFAVSQPMAGEWRKLETTPLEDSHMDLTLEEVVGRFQQRLPRQNKADAYRLGRTLIQLSERHMMSPGLLLSVIETESSYRYGVVSKAGAVGLMQLLPTTAEEVARRYHITSYQTAEDLKNPVVNLKLGVAYMAYLRGRFGHSVHYLAAYNMGPTALSRKIKAGNYELGAINSYVSKIQTRTLKLRAASLTKKPSLRRLEKQKNLAKVF